MQAARRARGLSYKGSHISVYEDVSIRKRQEFHLVKQQLRDQGILSGMLYPAVLRVSHDGQEKFFRQPQDVVTFLRALKLLHPAHRVSSRLQWLRGARKDVLQDDHLRRKQTGTCLPLFKFGEQNVL
ncbi:hypothetical protein SRHO_G00241280 [Serrasalmus rhombeus]